MPWSLSCVRVTEDYVLDVGSTHQNAAQHIRDQWIDDYRREEAVAADKKRPRQKEAYIHDYDGALTGQIVARRSADIHGAFFLPYLRAGMTLLDCGCGPGSITTGLAQAVSPGEVIGVDLEESQLEIARASAAELGLGTVRFDTGNAYELAYRDDHFDAVFSHALLEHMLDPLAVLKELHRVLKRGGVIGIRSIDLAATLTSDAASGACFVKRALQELSDPPRARPGVRRSGRGQ